MFKNDKKGMNNLIGCHTKTIYISCMFIEYVNAML